MIEPTIHPNLNQPKPARQCRTCGVAISATSRGLCKRCSYISSVRPVPDNFVAILRRLGSHGAAREFSASLSTITMWRRQIGLEKHYRAKKPTPQFRPRGFREASVFTNRDQSPIGQAVDFLRKYGSVYRCTESGKPDAKGEFWKRNFTVLSDIQVIDRARRLGWTETEI